MGRIAQVFRYGSIHAGQIAEETGRKKAGIFLDILRCYFRYKIWSNEYRKERFWELSAEERDRIGNEYRQKGKARDAWLKSFLTTQKFTAKWSSRKWCTTLKKRAKRNKAYQAFYHMGTNVFVDHGVEITRQHYLNGSIRVGEHVTFAKNVTIDYSGDVLIGNGVDIMGGVSILTHDHRFQHEAIPHHTSKEVTAHGLTIGDGAAIGSKAVILPNCNRIGNFARIGAGAVVTKDVPDYAVVVGVPAQVIKYLDKA